MTTEELLIPRYKVTGPYPFSPYKVGEIITPNNGSINFIAAQTETYYHFLPISRIAEMENLFEPLLWWKDRKVEDMPQFVKVIPEDISERTGLICKVHRWSPIENKFASAEGDVGAELEGYEPSYLCRDELNFPGQKYGRPPLFHLL